MYRRGVKRVPSGNPHFTWLHKMIYILILKKASLNLIKRNWVISQLDLNILIWFRDCFTEKKAVHDPLSWFIVWEHFTLSWCMVTLVLSQKAPVAFLSISIPPISICQLSIIWDNKPSDTPQSSLESSLRHFPQNADLVFPLRSSRPPSSGPRAQHTDGGSSTRMLPRGAAQRWQDDSHIPSGRPRIWWCWKSRDRFLGEWS